MDADSSSSPSSSSSKATKHKRKRETESTSDSDSDTSDYESDSPSETRSANDKLATPVVEDDIPVLSHAAKRKQKKLADKQQRQLEDSADSALPKKKRKLKDGSAIPPKDAINGNTVKRQNSIWVGNMAFKTTEENLRTFFKDRGVGCITRVNMPTKAVKGPTARGPGLRVENRGFAYVDFETPEAKQAAIAVSEQPLLGRKLLIKDGDDYSGRPNQTAAETTSIAVNGVKKSLSKSAQKILRNQKQPPAPTLFLGNLSFDATVDSIRELLEAHREKDKQKGKSKEEIPKEEETVPWIRKVRLGTFEDSGKCKGFAFVDFSTTELATSALINPKNHHLNGRDLVVEYASAEAVRRGSQKGHKQTSQGDASIPTERTERKFKMKKEPPLHIPKATILDEERADVVKWGTANTPKSLGKPSRPKVDRQRDEDKGRSRSRPKPGAALALAKRESAAIVPSQGRKITF